jgi:hypothetical protein
LSRPEKPGFFLGKKKPAMEIAGMCLPLKPQKERVIPAQQSLRKFFFESPTWYGCSVDQQDSAPQEDGCICDIR